jgi:site-specific DNA-methyltransferase (adenine-specific)|tara:strand:- start:677 stop:1681 length:1005 start_codon:yes stop_codon:yes gene_type:complete
MDIKDLDKLNKRELLDLCEKHKLTKYKSKSKPQLIALLQNKPTNDVIQPTNDIVQPTNDIVQPTNDIVQQEQPQELVLDTIYDEDCIDGMKKIKENSVDIIICDPPYNIGKDFGNNSDKQQMDEYFIWCDKWISECLRILKPHGTMYIYGFSEILAFIRTRITCNVRWLIWHYTNKVTPSLNFWQRTHESILCCYKEKPIFNRDDVREPYTDTFLKNSAGKVRKATVGRFSDGTKETTYTAHEGGALPRDVIKTSALAGGAGKRERVDHPTQKPLNLCDTLIKASINKNAENLLVVPFVGSGSECVSAKKHGVKYIGFEINTTYIDIANKRLNP